MELAASTIEHLLLRLTLRTISVQSTFRIVSNAALDSIALRIFSAAYDPDTLTASRREEKTCSLKTVKITKQMRIDLENRGTDAAFRLRDDQDS